MSVCRPTFVLGAIGLIFATPVAAQIVPDTSVGTTVTPDAMVNGVVSDRIDGGTIRGGNLFHSFSEFNIQNGRGAYFTNPEGITNIFSRITGNNPSNINGILGVLGNANLFLLNPNGIIFGPNARLDLNGSFIGTTASSIKFADGVEFSATNPSTSPLLTVSVPIGLQVGANPAPITVRGLGHQIVLDLATFTFHKDNRPVGLQVPTGQTLALVGGDILLDGGNLTARDGRIETWSVRNTEVALDTSSTLQLRHLGLGGTDWGTVTLQQSASMDASGTQGGAIQIRGRGLTLRDASNIFSDTQGSGKGQGISVQTTEFVDLLGLSAPGQLIIPGIQTFAFGGSDSISGDIRVTTQRLLIDNGDSITAFPAGNGSTSGDVIIQAADVTVKDFMPFPPFFSNGIGNVMINDPKGNTGDIIIDAERVAFLNGGFAFAAILVGAGEAGDIIIRASESVEIRGNRPDGVLPAITSSIGSDGNGRGGNIFIDTGKLTLAEGGQISSGVEPSAAGQGGDITIRAEEVSISDPVLDPNTQTISGINAAVGEGATGNSGNITITADRLRVFGGGQITSANEGSGRAGNINLQVRDLEVQGSGSLLAIDRDAALNGRFGVFLPENGRLIPSAISASSTGEGAAGSVNITANTLRVSESAGILVSNTGGGDAGNLNITARTIFLDNRASLRAEVNGGTQGNINLNIRDSLILRRGSSLTANATGASTGGNVSLNSPTIVGLENSDIIANAVEGNGGNIQINTQGIFGLENRPQLTPGSDITASSQFGVSGTINISILNFNQQNLVAPPPSNFVSTDQVVANRCLAGQGNSQGTFTIAGNGGLPETPETGTIPYQVVQVRAIETSQAIPRQPESKTTPTDTPIWKPGDPIVEATEFSVNAQGQVVLTANVNTEARANAHPQPIPCQLK